MTETRLAQPADLPAVAAFIAQLNAHPSTQSLHCTDRTAATLRRTLGSLQRFPAGWHRFFVLATRLDGTLLAVFGCQFDDEDEKIGWLWGPWLSDEASQSAVAPDLLSRLLAVLPRSTQRIDAFLHVENRLALRFLLAHGFSSGQVTHLYTLPRSGWALPADFSPLPALRPAHEIAFARLHGETFPAHGSTPAQILLAGQDDEHAVFAAADGLRLLGSVCVSVNHAPLEGFVDYLAVKPIARGRGVGIRLLQTALHWTFETHRLPQATLCVTDWRGDARRLYEKAGFSLQGTGLAVRLDL